MPLIPGRTGIEIKKLPGTWFHGTPHDFDVFDTAHLGKGNDQLGSGFYFTNKESTADGYALKEEGSRVLTADLLIAKPLTVDVLFSYAQIEGMLRASGNFYETLANFGEVGFEAEKVVVDRAVQTYIAINKGTDDALSVLNTISNDFWGGDEAKFLVTVREQTGYDGLVRSSGDEAHAVAWFSEQIRIVDVRLVELPSLQPR